MDHLKLDLLCRTCAIRFSSSSAASRADSRESNFSSSSRFSSRSRLSSFVASLSSSTGSFFPELLVSPICLSSFSNEALRASSSYKHPPPTRRYWYVVINIFLNLIQQLTNKTKNDGQRALFCIRR